MRNPILILATALAGGALALGLWSWQQWAGTKAGLEQKPAVESGTVLPQPRPLPDITLVNHNGENLPADSLTPDWSLWFFGFTHCPDICPNTLGLLSAVKAELAAQPESPALQLVFVSVDPQRDSPARLREYVGFFDPEMMGVTGTKTAIDTLTNALYLPYVLNAPDETGNYNVEHSGALVLIGPDGAAHAYFTPPLKIAALVSDLGQLMRGTR